jgi:hypothetical protein
VSFGSAGACTVNVSITMIENLLAFRLYARVEENLNLILGALSLHLDSPLVHMVVHGVPTKLPLDSLQQEFTTYNPKLTMAFPSCLLTKLEQRKEKKATSVVIAHSGNMAEEVASHPQLFAFSSTLHAEPKLHFSPFTQ